MMKFSPLQSFLFFFFFFIVLLQVSWCLANEEGSNNGEKLAALQGHQAEEGTFIEVGLQALQTNSVGNTGPVDVPNVKYPRKLRNDFMSQTMSLSHKGGAGAGGGSGGGGGGGGAGSGGGGRGTGGSGSESNHQGHKKNSSAISLANPWKNVLLEIGIYAIAILPFTLF